MTSKPVSSALMCVGWLIAFSALGSGAPGGCYAAAGAAATCGVAAIGPPKRKARSGCHAFAGRLSAHEVFRARRGGRRKHGTPPPALPIELLTEQQSALAGAARLLGSAPHRASRHHSEQDK